MPTPEEADEQFYRDTDSIAFPALTDEQLATLKSLGTRRKVKRGEIQDQMLVVNDSCNMLWSDRNRISSK
jgi:hypothetical protein